MIIYTKEMCVHTSLGLMIYPDFKSVSKGQCDILLVNVVYIKGYIEKEIIFKSGIKTGDFHDERNLNNYTIYI